MRKYRRLYLIEAEKLTEGRQVGRPSGVTEFGHPGDWLCTCPTTGLQWIMKDKHFQTVFVLVPKEEPVTAKEIEEKNADPPDRSLGADEPLTVATMMALFGIPAEIAQRMIEHGKETLGHIAACYPVDLFMIEGIGGEVADELIRTATHLLETVPKEAGAVEPEE